MRRLDAIDRNILRELQEDGRITNVELARRVGISAPPCLRRVRSLEEAGYIRGYRALLDEKALGCEVLIVSNACGGMNPQWAKGDIMLIEDHINLIGDNPLIGKNDDRLGVRFPDMCHPYDTELLALAQRIAVEERITCHKGVFVAVSGPNLETRAEYRFLRGIGADVVGMSTVPEVIVGVHSGLRNFGVSVITDLCLPDALEPVKLEDILETADKAEKKLRVLVRRLVEELK